MIDGRQRERHELIRDSGIDCKPVQQTSVHVMNARALLADQRAFYAQVTRNPHGTRIHAATRQHYPDTGFQQVSFTGINYTRLELDFIVG